MNYFELRKNNVDEYQTYIKPDNIINVLNKNDKILDFGFGKGYLLRALRQDGFSNLSGCEIDEESLANENLFDINLIDLNKDELNDNYDVIILSHVIEHIKKQDVIEFLANLRKRLNRNGKLIISTPNAQSTTGVFWLYADFTHEYIYTVGSLYYVLTASGYTNIRSLEEGASCYSVLLPLYKKFHGFINKITQSFYDHRFENKYSFELVFIADKNE